MVDIKGYEGKYAITSCGKVWSYKTKKFLRTHKNSKGYERISLFKDNGNKSFAIHKLVAMAHATREWRSQSGKRFFALNLTEYLIVRNKLKEN
jgi:hypothetical protein